MQIRIYRYMAEHGEWSINLWCIDPTEKETCLTLSSSLAAHRERLRVILHWQRTFKYPAYCYNIFLPRNHRPCIIWERRFQNHRSFQTSNHRSAINIKVWHLVREKLCYDSTITPILRSLRCQLYHCSEQYKETCSSLFLSLIRQDDTCTWSLDGAECGCSTYCIDVTLPTWSYGYKNTAMAWRSVTTSDLKLMPTIVELRSDCIG